MTTIATHDHPHATTQALQVRAMLSPGPIRQVAMQPSPIAMGDRYVACCGDPECREEHLWQTYQALALVEHTAEQFDLAQAAWKIENRACLLRQAEVGLRTWASAAEHIARMDVEAAR